MKNSLSKFLLIFSTVNFISSELKAYTENSNDFSFISKEDSPSTISSNSPLTEQHEELLKKQKEMSKEDEQCSFSESPKTTNKEFPLLKGKSKKKPLKKKKIISNKDQFSSELTPIKALKYEIRDLKNFIQIQSLKESRELRENIEYFFRKLRKDLKKMQKKNQ
jgi:hypothetical protein